MEDLMLFFLAALLRESWLLLLLLGLLPWPSCRPDRLHPNNAREGGKNEAGETTEKTKSVDEEHCPHPRMSLISSWLAAWPASLFSRMECGVVGGEVSQRMVALSSWVACGTVRRKLEKAHSGCKGEQAESEL